MDETFERDTPSSPDHSSARLPLADTSACPLNNAAHVRNTKITTAIVTNCVFLNVRPSKYIATARDPNIALLRLHMLRTSLIFDYFPDQTVGTGTSRRMP